MNCMDAHALRFLSQKLEVQGEREALLDMCRYNLVEPCVGVLATTAVRVPVVLLKTPRPSLMASLTTTRSKRAEPKLAHRTN